METLAAVGMRCGCPIPSSAATGAAQHRRVDGYNEGKCRRKPAMASSSSLTAVRVAQRTAAQMRTINIQRQRSNLGGAVLHNNARTSGVVRYIVTCCVCTHMDVLYCAVNYPYGKAVELLIIKFTIYMRTSSGKIPSTIIC